MKQVVCSVCGGTEGVSPVPGWVGMVFCTTCAAASETATGEALKHDADCLGHSECSCALPRFKARVAALLHKIEECERCPICGANSVPCDTDCALVALLKECGE